MYVIVEIDRVPEEARDVSTWIRVLLTVYACILREAVGVRTGLRRVTQGSSACFTRHKTPTILAKSPAKSLLLITRQREYHGQGILLFIMMWFISLEPLSSVFPPPRFPCSRVPSPFLVLPISLFLTFLHISSLCHDDTYSLALSRISFRHAALVYLPSSINSKFLPPRPLYSAELP